MRKEFSLAMRALLFIAIAVAAWLMGIIVGQENAVIILNPNTSTANVREASNPNVSIMLDYNNGDIDILENISSKEIEFELNKIIEELFIEYFSKNDQLIMK